MRVFKACSVKEREKEGERVACPRGSTITIEKAGKTELYSLDTYGQRIQVVIGLRERERQKIRACSKRFSFSQSVRMHDYFINIIECTVEKSK
jgi:hypothetical protein